MAQDKRQVDAITARDVDFAQWYTDVCKKAELIDYTSREGHVHLPALWLRHLGEHPGGAGPEFKETGHENVYLPVLIPESLLQKEKDHVEGFAPECAWVTMGGSEKLEDRLCVRPTSETLFCEHYANIIHSWRDLPKLYNQWCSVLRWEKTSRPFLRHREFLWQEGHTMHATAEEAREETMRMLNIYADFFENVLAMPVIKGRKTDKEKFNGAEETYTVECMMHDHKALQAGTSHYFGDGFAKAFDITFTGKDNQPALSPPDQLGRQHPDDRRHHHDPRRRQRPGAAAPDRPHPGGGDPRGGPQARRAGGGGLPAGPAERGRRADQDGRLRQLPRLEVRGV